MSTAQRRIKRGWMNLKVSKIIEDNHNTKTLIFEDAQDSGRQFDYIAGQYLTFRFDSLSAKPIVRSYTMSSSPNQSDFIAVTVKEVDDGFVSKHLVRDIAVGDILRARGPIGKFCFSEKTDTKNLVMVAAGSGVTPFISIMRQEADHLGLPGHPETLSLLVSYRSQNDLICWEDIVELRKKPGVKIIVSLSRESAEGFAAGRVSPQLLDELCLNQFDDKTYMTCGPEQMMQEVVDHLAKQNVPKEHIKLESFSS